jgi:hypothetical protein
MEIVHEDPALEMVPNIAEPVAVASSADTASELLVASPKPTQTPLARLWRRTARLRGEADAYRESSRDGEAQLELEVILLREQVARLKTELHRPADLGCVIDHLRRVTAQVADTEDEDDAWSALADCLTIREGLAQVSVEIEAAVGVAQQRFGGPGAKIDITIQGDTEVDMDLGAELPWRRVAFQLSDAQQAAA